MLGGDVAQGADHDLAAGFGVLGVVEVGGDPEPVPVAVRHRNLEAAVRFVEQLGEGFRDLPVRLRVGCRQRATKDETGPYGRPSAPYPGCR